MKECHCFGMQLVASPMIQLAHMANGQRSNPSIESGSVSGYDL